MAHPVAEDQSGERRGQRSQAGQLIELGRIGAPHGVRGWLRVFSDTDPPENILRYRPWLLDGEPHELIAGHPQGKALVARLAGCEDRDAASAFTGRRIAVYRDRLPPPKADEFYWIDLEGLAVQTEAGVDLGRVSHLFPTGANDVLVVQGERERLLPFVWGQVIKDVDFELRRILVEWDPEF